MKYPHVVRYVFEKPWAILQPTLETIVEIVQLRAEGGEITVEEIRERVGDKKDEHEARIEAARDTTRKSGGLVAVVPLYGVLMPRATMMSDMSGGTSMQRFSATLRQLANDPDIGSILLDVDSPGGHVDQIPETAALIREVRKSKQVWAIANAGAASAAYWLASQVDEFVVTPSGMVGSIGVVATHRDWSQFDEKMGVKTTFIHSGRFKVEGNSFEPLSDEGRERIQAVTDEFYGMFVADVAKGRGVTTAKVRQDFGDGRMLTAKEALAVGMVDKIDTFENTVARLARGTAPGRRTSAQAGRNIEVTITGNTSNLDAELKRLAAIAGTDEENCGEPDAAPPEDTELLPGTARSDTWRRKAFAELRG